jgi:hypothetical protein
MGAWRRVIELSIDDGDLVKLTSITGEPGRTGADIAGLPEKPIFLCSWTSLGGPPSDG